MHRFAGGLIAMRIRGAVAPWAALVAAGLLAVAAAPAAATITPLTHDSKGAMAAAQAMTADPGFISGSATFLAVPSGNSVATADAASGFPSFPRTVPTFLLLSTGDAMQADDADQPDVVFPSTDDRGTDIRNRVSAFDETILRIPFTVGPAGAAALPGCLSFDFRFLSEEYPTRLASPFTDTFIAELAGQPNWTAPDSTITAPNNFATVNGQPLTIKSTGPATLAPSEAAGTPYGAATALLHVQALVPAVPAPPTSLALAVALRSR